MRFAPLDHLLESFSVFGHHCPLALAYLRLVRDFCLRERGIPVLRILKFLPQLVQPLVLALEFFVPVRDRGLFFLFFDGRVFPHWLPAFLGYRG